MRAENLFAIVKAKWPEQVDITDAELLGAKGFLSWELNRLDEDIDAEKTSDAEIVQAALWPFHQALSHLAQTQFQLGAAAVFTSAVSFDDFIRFLKDGLEDPSWAEERDLFQRENPDLYVSSPTVR